MDALEAIFSQHSLLCFDPRPVELGQIEAVLRAAAAAPSPANLQPWAFLVVTDPCRIERIASYLCQVQREQIYQSLLGLDEAETALQMEPFEALEHAPCFIFVCLDPKVDFALPAHRTALRDWYLLSLGGAAANLTTAASALGLGTRWIGSFPLDQGGKLLKDMLGIPWNVEIVAATPLAYHSDPCEAAPYQQTQDLAGFQRGNPAALERLLHGKLPLSAVVHHDDWGRE